MNILYIGDIMGGVGVEVVEKLLPQLRAEKSVDLAIAQSENVTDGRAMNVVDYQRLRKAGVDGFTGGNHSIARTETLQLLADPGSPVTGPTNMPDCPGPGYKIVKRAGKTVVIISMLGQIVGRHAEKPVDNPLQAIDQLLARLQDTPRDATIVNFHGDYSSEKVVFGHYLDGRVTAVIGDHWHVPTADARVLPGGTAHITDVGMCGVLDSSLGVSYASIIPRWRDGIQTKNSLETEGPRQFNALLVLTDINGLAESAEQIRIVL